MLTPCTNCFWSPGHQNIKTNIMYRYIKSKYLYPKLYKRSSLVFVVTKFYLSIEKSSSTPPTTLWYEFWSQISYRTCIDLDNRWIENLGNFELRSLLQTLKIEIDHTKKVAELSRWTRFKGSNKYKSNKNHQGQSVPAIKLANCN